ncbi:uncharacterized protein K452DRAFT_289974 [Aplosporella prunicola CBS 121167]|uniref:tRNA-splicing endonuclease subunit Sen15 domain-containing protein n=1 Tax=Aplosporella prunicola CBS 121167 TaxID=1176127 RepID=A0A6A6B6C6_9PEZI|nr:uncharacterized protein K452DRAFT_289974 [Aplosporella prunicola CBS 121167]KAF2139416.1 hypothetical protein K452DRAFT_289974 [Aplosporella prunicola CBS 121167]
MLSGLPPRRLYTHPDEQVALLKAGVAEPAPQREWVLPTQLREAWTLGRMADVFAGVCVVPEPIGAGIGKEGEGKEWEWKDAEEEEHERKWRTAKRVLLAVVEDDSTVVYYLVHDGLVKPRQN